MMALWDNGQWPGQNDNAAQRAGIFIAVCESQVSR